MNPVRVIYQSVSSCTGVSDVTTAHGETATGIYWTDAGVEMPCDVDAVAGQVPDIGLSDVYASSCDGVTVPANFKDFHGPIQVMTFITPPSSKETSISQERGSSSTASAAWARPLRRGRTRPPSSSAPIPPVPVE